MYFFSNNSCSYIFSSDIYGMLIMQGVWDTGTAPGTRSIVKSMSLFGGSPGISSGKTSLNSCNTEQSFNLGVSFSVASKTWDAYNQQPFLHKFFNCIVETFLIEITFGMPLTTLGFPYSSMHSNALLQQSSLTLCASNQSIPMRIY